MRLPESLISLVERGVLEDVIRPLMSGKEAQVFLVTVEGRVCVAKIYKDAAQRSFKNRADYTEGRKVRNTRDRRAMSKNTKHGRAQQEARWRAAEAETIYRLRDIGVRVPEPITYVDDVLVMELVADQKGEPAPRLGELRLRSERAEEWFELLLRDVVKMLCAGIVHGDLSEFNILVGADGPVVIDFPQAVDAANNNNARKLLLRDVGNLVRFFGRYSRRLRKTKYGEEIWSLYEKGELLPDTPLTGKFKRSTESAEVTSLLEEIAEMERENRAKRVALGLPPSRPARQPKPIEEAPPTATDSAPSKKRRRRRRRSGGPGGESGNARTGDQPSPQRGSGKDTSSAPSRRGGRRRRGVGSGHHR